MLARVDPLDADLADLDAKLAELIAVFAGAFDPLDQIPGIGQLAARLLLANLGTDMTQFPTAWHLRCWDQRGMLIQARGLTRISILRDRR